MWRCTGSDDGTAVVGAVLSRRRRIRQVPAQLVDGGAITSRADAAPGHAKRRPRGDAQEHFGARPPARRSHSSSQWDLLPHLPFVFPESFLAQYPASSISLPANAYAPDGMPAIAWQTYGETRNYDDIAKLYATASRSPRCRRRSGAAPRLLFRRQLHRPQHRQYPQHARRRRNARVDDRRVLGRSRVAAGEHGLWDKHELHPRRTRPSVPRPRPHDGGVRTYEYEMVDIFPTSSTLRSARRWRVPARLAGGGACTEGTSKRLLIGAPTTAVGAAAFSVYDDRSRRHCRGRRRRGRLRWAVGVRLPRLARHRQRLRDGLHDADPRRRRDRPVHRVGAPSGTDERVAPKWRPHAGTEPTTTRSTRARIATSASVRHGARQDAGALLHGGWEGSGRSALTHRK